jgi:hypothetical protein
MRVQQAMPIFLTNNSFLLRSAMVCLAGIAFFCVGFADVTSTESSAVDFARQVGIIIGFGQACSNSASDTLLTRSHEYIDAAANDAADKNNANNILEESRRNALATFSAQHLSCAKVNSDLQGLPLLKWDYRQTVITPLLANKIPARAPAIAAPGATNSTSAIAAAPAANNALAPSAAATLGLGPPPTQAYTTNSNLDANIAPINPINPIYNSNSVASEEMRLKLAQQLITTAQGILANNRNAANGSSPNLTPPLP